MRLTLKLMESLSNIRWGAVAKYTWVFSAAGILFLGLGTFLIEPSGTVFSTVLLSFMILLSFPSGFGFFLVAWPFIDISPPIDFLLLWLGVFLVGYFQWFHVVSNLRGGVITLSLSQAQPTANAKQGPIKDPVLPRASVNRKRASRMVHFDAAGRTPLERAIESTSRKSSRRLTAP